MISIAVVSIVFFAGILRGLTGFGFALVAAIGLGQFWPPTETTPVVLLIDLALTMLLLRRTSLADFDARRLGPVILSGLIGVLLGTYAVAVMPPPAAKLALNISVFASAAVSLVRPNGAWLDTRGTALCVGLVYGTLVGAFAVGGPFVVVWFLGIGVSPAIVRSNLILLFGLTDVLALAPRILTGTIAPEVAWTSLLLIAPALGGALLGERWFQRVDPAHWRRIAAITIAGAALVSLIGQSLTAF